VEGGELAREGLAPELCVEGVEVGGVPVATVGRIALGSSGEVGLWPFGARASSYG